MSLLVVSERVCPDYDAFRIMSVEQLMQCAEQTVQAIAQQQHTEAETLVNKYYKILQVRYRVRRDDLIVATRRYKTRYIHALHTNQH